MEYRPARPDDAGAIAALHAANWQRDYRGILTDAYLDGDLTADHRDLWTSRLAHPEPGDRTVVAVAGGALAGFAHTVLDDDPTWGALLDNLHVDLAHKRTGVGTRLMAATAAAVLAGGRPSGLYLWVLEDNRAAQAFYGARGGRCVGSEPWEPPGGGATVTLRYVWPDASALLLPG